MNRRKFLAAAATVGTALTALPGGRTLLGADETNTSPVKGMVTGKSKLTPPVKGSIPVAILISEGLNVIDFSGPWGVFESVSLPNATEAPFQLFTVAEKAETVISGSGLKLVPHYTFANAPEMKVVVIPAQKGSDAMTEWLRKVAPTADVTMSVCTGAFKLAKAGLLSGKAATTHHDTSINCKRNIPTSR